MRYLSTRGDKSALNFSQILLGGLAPDGGLYLPESYPRFTADDLAAMRGMDYRQLAFAVLSRLADDIPPDDLKALIDKTYTAATYCHGRKDSDFSQITPVRKLEVWLVGFLELSNGPTLAFKDMAMQLLGNLFEYVLDEGWARTSTSLALPPAIPVRRRSMRCAASAMRTRLHAFAGGTAR
jgi:threonine synthase